MRAACLFCRHRYSTALIHSLGEHSCGLFLPTRHQVRIDAECHADAGMSQPLAHKYRTLAALRGLLPSSGCAALPGLPEALHLLVNRRRSLQPRAIYASPVPRGLFAETKPSGVPIALVTKGISPTPFLQLIAQCGDTPSVCVSPSWIPYQRPPDSDPGSFPRVPDPGTPTSTGEC